MNTTIRRLSALLLAMLMLSSAALPAQAAKKKKKTAAPAVTVTPAVPTASPEAAVELLGITVSEDGEYTDRDHVAAYIRAYHRLPSNYITKRKAEEYGGIRYCKGKSIGGDRFGNYEGKLPDAPGRRWTECDIDYDGWSRNAKRIVFSNDGLIYYTEDHYETFVNITEPETRAGP